MNTNILCILVILTLEILPSKEDCFTPNNEKGDCISLDSCPRLINRLTNDGGSEYVNRSRCGSTLTDDTLVCCPLPTGNCTTPDNKEGRCTLLSACPQLIKLLATHTHDSAEYLRKSGCGITNSKVFLCCPLELPKNQNEQNSTTDNDSLLTSYKYCGYQHSDDYLVQGQGATISEFPWLAGINYIKINGEEAIQCQGVIINTQYILTAGHCIKVPRNAPTLKSVRLGEYNTKNATDCVGYAEFIECSDPVQEYGIEETIVHPGYSTPPYGENDIALIRLNETIKRFSDYIRPICLPTFITEHPKIGDKVITTGWGKTSITGEAAHEKKKIFNVVISNKECQDIFNQYTKKIVVNVTENLMCTKDLSDNTEFFCIGDSGGPVMFSNKFQWYIEGINSFKTNQCGDKYPVVHTRVSKYLEWIRANMRP